MKLNDKFPEMAKASLLYPDNLMGPHPEPEAVVELEGRQFTVKQGWAYFACGVCGQPCSWSTVEQGEPPAMICSEECLRTFEGLSVAEAPSLCTVCGDPLNDANNPQLHEYCPQVAESEARQDAEDKRIAERLERNRAEDLEERSFYCGDDVPLPPPIDKPQDTGVEESHDTDRGS